MDKRKRKRLFKVLAFIFFIGILLSGKFLYGFYFASGQLKSIACDKKEYSTGEPVMITATGTKADWVGIYKNSDNIKEVNPVYWYYVNDADHMSGDSYDVKEQNVNRDREDALYLPEGTYKAVLLYNDTWFTISETKIEVKGDGLPSSPRSIEYTMDDTETGMADGTVLVKFSDEMSDITRNISLYWADENGKIQGYSRLAKFKIQGKSTEYEMKEHTVIPEEATRILAYGNNEYGESEECAEYCLPDNSGYKIDDELIGEFAVFSDTHINQNGGSQRGELHFMQAVSDMEECVKENWGLFIVGDITDTGNENEYDKVWEMMDNCGSKIPVYLTVGNHDLSNGIKDGSKLFMKNAGSSEMYYQTVINGYHFISMGSEKSGNYAYFSSEQLQWLQKTLENCRQEHENRPVFLFIHQPLYNTVAGSMQEQGWDGISADDDCEEKLREILKDNPQVIMFNGHTHWDLNSERTLYYKSDDLPTILNTASVAYLWSSYDIPEGEYLEGSQGYFVKIYRNKILILGRDFLNRTYIPSAMFVIDTIGERENK